LNILIVKTGSITLPFQRGKNDLEITMYIIISTAIICYVDIVTPIGLAVWLLYFFPLFLTIYLSWKYAPFLAAGVFTILSFVDFIVSPSRYSPVFELTNRIFFAAVLFVGAYFIYWMIQFTDRQLSH